MKRSLSHKVWFDDCQVKGIKYRPLGPFRWKDLKFWKRSEWPKIRKFLKERHELGINILPAYNYDKIFRSLTMTPFGQTKIVILGQDPYYTKGVPDGLAFSILPNIGEVPAHTKANFKQRTFEPSRGKFKLPGSLANIVAEYREDLGFPHPRSGDLSTWARNGILLLNTIWTVEEGRPRSHNKIGGSKLWQELTAEILVQLSNRKDKLVFILWGRVAQEWKYLIDGKKHLIIEGPHPSKMNRRSGPLHKFRGGKYFSRACEFLGINKSIWRLP